ncbi:MAG: hypothetical protein AB1757_07970 [Acidobacteriota bacterium]
MLNQTRGKIEKNSARSIIFACIITLNLAMSVFAVTPKDPKAWVRAAIEAMGGETQLKNLRSLKFEAIGHRFWVEQSERPEGPWIVSYDQITESRDLTNNKILRATQSKMEQLPNWNGTSLIIADGVAMRTVGTRKIPGQVAEVEQAKEDLATSPEKVLLNALAATDLRAESDTLLQGVPHHVVVFTLNGNLTRLFLNANTALPTGVETVRAYPDFFWGIWGDVKMRTLFSYWTLEAGGIRYPKQWDIYGNGIPNKSLTLTKLEFNAAIAPDSFAIPDEVRKAFEANASKAITLHTIALGQMGRPVQEITPDLIQIPGAWNVVLIRQSDGIVILESPISSEYSAKVIEETAKRFPNAPIKAVITTSDAWPHFGGLREYVARGIPVYALDLNQPILERLIASSHRLIPDALTRAPKKPRFAMVSKKTVIGEGKNRIELYPIRTEAGERMMMAYFPEHRMLYASDLIQFGGGNFFMPQYLAEVMDAVNREHLTVDKVFAMHLTLMDWKKITDAVEKAKMPASN